MSNTTKGPFMQAMEKYTKSIKTFISAQGFGHYSKPSGGIPKTDLEQSVQNSLGKADTALQSFSESDPTVPAWAKASSKPSYTASEVGLGKVGNFKAVSTEASQGLSDTEKSNARANIGAGTGNGTYSKPSGGIPKTDLASAVQTSLGKADSALQSETDPTVPAWAKAASKPSYTASEVGLGNVGNFKAVSTVASQGLSDTEKSNARANIGAGTGNGTYSKPSGGIPKTDLASAVQTSLGLADGALQHTTVSGSPDLDTYLATGVYHITTSTATHAPTTNHATLFVDATVGTPYQIFKPDNVDSPWYTRHRSGSSWTAWAAMKFTDTTYSAATTSAAGLMSATDKTKLNGIATGATKTTVDSALSSTSTNPVQNKVINSALAGKASTAVATTSAAGLMSATDKTKLDEIADSGTLGSLFIDSTNYRIGNRPSYQGKHVFGCVSMRPMSGGYYIGTIQSGWTPSENTINGIAVIEKSGAFSVTTYYWTSRSGLNINTSPPDGSNVLLLFDYLAA